ncbi:MAG: hypothetical protein KJ709_01845 [Nanoarchaeota archaeon]|nr:hypothetical protein [Nanoarchaeota archaeon]
MTVNTACDISSVLEEEGLGEARIVKPLRLEKGLSDSNVPRRSLFFFNPMWGYIGEYEYGRLTTDRSWISSLLEEDSPLEEVYGGIEGADKGSDWQLMYENLTPEVMDAIDRYVCFALGIETQETTCSIQKGIADSEAFLNAIQEMERSKRYEHGHFIGVSVALVDQPNGYHILTDIMDSSGNILKRLSMKVGADLYATRGRGKDIIRNTCDGYNEGVIASGFDGSEPRYGEGSLSIVQLSKRITPSATRPHQGPGQGTH